MVSEADNFFLEFHKSFNGEDRAIVLAALLFLDYVYFENGDSGANNNGGLLVNN